MYKFLCGPMFSIFLSVYLGVKLGYMITTFVWETVSHNSKVNISFYISTDSEWKLLSFPYFHPHLLSNFKILISSFLSNFSFILFFSHFPISPPLDKLAEFIILLRLTKKPIPLCF